MLRIGQAAQRLGMSRRQVERIVQRLCRRNIRRTSMARRTQFSTTRSSTRLNSCPLLVTSTQPSARA
ncbi:hypothetical protein LJR290_005983 [Variovorax sp. LjRoot290]